MTTISFLTFCLHKRREPKENEARKASRRSVLLMYVTDCETEAQQSYTRRSSL
jgi:hypothetical protein